MTFVTKDKVGLGKSDIGGIRRKVTGAGITGLFRRIRFGFQCFQI